jgi:hypothetical protein
MGTVTFERTKRYWELEHRRKTGPNAPTQTTRDRGLNYESLNYVDKDGKMPGWRYLIHHGASATTQLTGVRRKFEQAEVFAYKKGVANGWQGWLYQDSGLAPLPAFPADPVYGDALLSAAASAAATDFLDKYRQATTPFEGGSFLAEIGDVVQLLTNPLSAVYAQTVQFVGKVKKLRRVHEINPLSYVAQVSNAWLSYNWGIKPLAGDLVHYAIALDQLLGDINGGTYTPISAKATRRGNAVNLINQSVPGVHSAVQDISGYTEAECRFYGKVRTAPAQVSAQEIFGLDLPGVINGVWESIPFSSILDYFANTGDVLQSLTVSEANLAWANKAVKITNVMNGSGIRFTPGWGAPSFESSASGGSYTAISELKHRESSGLPRLEFQFKNGLSVPQVANIAALTNLIWESRPG